MIATLVSVTAAPAGPSPQDEARKQKLADKARGASQALDALKHSNARVHDEQKANARAKLEALKERLRRLRMMGASPQQIAALAKELKAAVKAYASAGGSSAQADGAPAEPAASPPSPKDEAAAPVADKPARAPDDRKPENPYEKAIAANAQGVAAAARKASDSQQDRDFISQARQLAKQLKAAAVQAAQKAQQSGKPGDAADAVKAAEAAEKAIADAEHDLGGGDPLGAVSVSV